MAFRADPPPPGEPPITADDIWIAMAEEAIGEKAVEEAMRKKGTLHRHRRWRNRSASTNPGVATSTGTGTGLRIP